jgi:hypothetical protein
MSIKQRTLATGAILGSLVFASCSLDVPDLNNPGLNQIADEPTAISINTAATGMLINNRGGKAATTGLVNQLGILGRESFTFTTTDNRFIGELLEGKLAPTSAFGGVFWALDYANIRLGNLILAGLDKVPDFTDANKAGTRGFVHTIQALELLTVILTHYDTGAVIDVDHPLGDPLGPFVSKQAVFVEIARLLDQAAGELASGGDSFTFGLGSGFTGFTKPSSTFLQFNRAIAARCAIYQATLATAPAERTMFYTTALTALTASFIVDNPAMTIDFKLGANYAFSLTAGDTANGLIDPGIVAHPALQTDAQKQADGTTLDARFVAKITPIVDADGKPVSASSAQDSKLSTSIKFKIYTNTSPIPIIRNEDLILLKAEALYFTGDKAGALVELNLVRTLSGKLPPIALPADDNAFINALLYERRYSLMFEGGHRWIDLRRFKLPLPMDSDKETQNIHFPVPQAECDARQSEPACAITSTDAVN